ncbi:type II toxin-antitoxin system RelE/ParE family toxin [Flavobacterium sp.]|uniref:type II toxin-antitoxin system RelE/ParE family toxin n=1 Tax=Flavobacterium sp. TaxID=239 RepID=UPI00286B8303|nr:type II toxin-antitoxin system RelE/ParE family toxin [Flavobacterium sp.]
MRKVNFSETAVKNLEDIKFYLISKWAERIYENFKNKLKENINLIATNPEAFPKSDKNIFKCVLIKQITIFYRFNSTEIQILSLFDTRQNPLKINKIK